MQFPCLAAGARLRSRKMGTWFSASKSIEDYMYSCSPTI